MRTDAFSPEWAPQLGFREKGSSYGYILNRPTYRDLRSLNGYVPHVAAVPNGANVYVAGNGHFEGRFQCPFGSVVWGFSVSSNQTEGFRFNFVDTKTGRALFSQPVDSWESFTQDGARNHMLILDEPLILSGLAAVQVWNQSAAAARIQIGVHMLQPTETAEGPEHARIQRRAAGIRPTRTEPAMQSATTGRPLLAVNAVQIPADPGDESYGPDQPVTSYTVPPGHIALVRQIQNRFIGSGFLDGSGDLLWRLAIDGAYVPGFDQINSQLGGEQFHHLGDEPIRVLAGQTITFSVSRRGGSAIGNAQTLCGLQGTLQPQR